MAGIVLKNELQGKNESRSRKLAEQWRKLDNKIQNTVRHKVLETLKSKLYNVRKTASRVLASITAIDLNSGNCGNSVSILSNNVTKGTSFEIIESSIMTLGYLCDICSAPILMKQIDLILTAVFHGMKNNNMNLKLVSCNAFYSCLIFAENSFKNKKTRNIIFLQLFNSTICRDKRVRRSALECLIKISFRFYPIIGFHLKDIKNVTMQLIKKDNEKDVVMQAIELWTALSDVEIEIMEQMLNEKELNIPCNRKLYHYIKSQAKDLCNVLVLKLFETSEDKDEWTVASAAITCISSMSRVIGNDIINCMMPFIAKNINHSEWKNIEAAIYAFSAIVDGPTSENMSYCASKMLSYVLRYVKHKNIIVRDTTIFCIGRIAQYQPSSIMSFGLNDVINALLYATTMEPNISEKSCWALIQIATFISTLTQYDEHPLLGLFEQICKQLLIVTCRNDICENNLKQNSYECLSMMIDVCPLDCHKFLEEIVLKELIRRLIKSTNQIQGRGNQNSSVNIDITQQCICCSLSKCTQTLDSKMIEYSNILMKSYITILRNKSTSIQRDLFMAIGDLANAIEFNFGRYMKILFPFLLKGLQNEKDNYTCIASINCIVDISYAIKKDLRFYTDDIMNAIIRNLRSSDISRDTKPIIISLIGDIAFGIGIYFKKYVNDIANIFKNAGNTKHKNNNDNDLVIYINTLRENLFSAYSSILQGIKIDNPSVFNPFMNNLIPFVRMICHDKKTDGEVLLKACNVIGDVCNVYGKRCKSFIFESFIKNLIQRCLSGNEKMKESALYTTEQIEIKFSNNIVTYEL